MIAPETIPDLTLLELQKALRAGELTALELTDACLARIAAREPEVGAWAFLDPELARAQAKACDAQAAAGAPLGPLHGIPVGLKDVIDTADMPTANGTPPDQGRRPEADAWVTARLRAAGAVILGKTTTTELAFMNPTATRNPHDPAHTPGGSSAGSAAAVAAGMVPLAIGTQTGGSVIRPAAFCGVVGVKPSFDAIPRDGVCMQSHTLDTLGVFARDPRDAAIAVALLVAPEGSDPARIREDAGAPVLRAASRRPVFGYVHPPEWERASPEMQSRLDALAADLGAVPVTLPEGFAHVAEQRAVINSVEMAWHYRRYRSAGWDLLSEVTRNAMDEGAATAATDYVAALRQREPLYAGLEEVFGEVDCLLCPPALGAAPHGLESTGDSIFNGLWTFMGTPCITLPLPHGDGELPLGVQLVGRRGEDKALLAKAMWVSEYLETL
ncbi:amidase [Dinoroseobacter sp. S375]|uniref:amidase n=1 Tax=Dinoroseobacter sp. S375 TaxID=3415136 RepID=UPI003C7CC388